MELTPEEDTLLAADRRRTSHTGWWLLAIMALMLTSAGIVAWQAIAWLRDGAWPPLPLRDALDWLGLPRPSFAWVGLQRIVGWMMGLPLAFAPFVVGTITVWIVFGDEPNSPALRSARMKEARKATERN